MKFGFIASSGTTSEVLEMAVAAEAAGWDGFFTWDGIAVGDMDVWDPWALLGAIAVKTERMTLGAMIFPLSRRRPWKVAREALTVDHLSNGRLVLPVGLGATDDAGFSRVSGEVTDRKLRAERLDETLAILDQAWTGEPVNHAGTHYQVRDVTFQPKPVQQPRIPIWVVAAWPAVKSMNRAIRWDGVLPAMRDDLWRRPTPEDVREIAAWVGEHRTAGGPFEIVLEGVVPGDDPAAARDHLQPLAAAGATWWIESRWEAPHNTPTALLERIEQGPPQV